MERYPLLSGQQRTWAIHGRDGQLSNWLEADVSGMLDEEIWEAAVATVISRHEILRTGYFNQPGLFYPLQGIGQNETPLGVSFTQTAEAHGRIRMSMPLIASDMPSLWMLLREIAECYEENTNSQAAASFLEYAAWSISLNEEGEEEGDAYWERTRRDDPGYKRFPFENPDPIGPHPTVPHPTVSKWCLSSSLVKKISAVAKSDGITMEAFLATCWKTLLWNYLDHPDALVVNRIVKGRYVEDFENIIGPLDKVLPFYTRPESRMSFREYASLVNKEIRIMDGWQETWTWKNPASVNQHTIPAAFEYNYFNASSFEKAGHLFSVTALFSGQDAGRLKFTCNQWDEELDLQLYYSAGLYSGAAIDCIREQLNKIIEMAIVDRSCPITSLPVSSGNEVIGSHRMPAIPDAAPAETLVSWYRQTAGLFNDKPALWLETAILTHGQLDRMSNRVANYLIDEWSVMPGDIVILKALRNEYLIAAMLGILKTGAAYLPVDANCPPARLRYIMENSGARVVVTSTPEEEVFPEGVRCLTISPERLFQTSDKDPGYILSPEAPAYIIYTSGSTGFPKGVVITHRSLVNYLRWLEQQFHLAPEDETVLFASVAYDLAYTALWSSLVCGCTLHILRESPVFDPDELCNCLQRSDISYIKITPSQFSLLLDVPDFEKKVAGFALRMILLGGEPVRAADVVKYLSFRPETLFVNHYGPTETTIGIMALPLGNETIQQYQFRQLLGNPVANNEIFILKDGRIQQPMGMAGEICVSGENLAAGYLHLDKMSREKFIDHPIRKGQKLYRTGDGGRLLPDFTIELLGRQDTQVKIRGYRVETGEVETMLRKHPSVGDAVVMVMGDDKGEKELAAFLQSSGLLSSKDVRLFLSERLPEYMLPAQILIQHKFPLLPNGKIDRKALTEWRTISGQAKTRGVPAGTDIEKQLVTIWQNVLGREDIGIYDNFFDHGGNSLKLILVMRKLSEAYPGKVNITDLFKFNTVSAIAAFLDQESRQENRQECAIEVFEV